MFSVVFEIYEISYKKKLESNWIIVNLKMMVEQSFQRDVREGEGIFDRKTWLQRNGELFIFQNHLFSPFFLFVHYFSKRKLHKYWLIFLSLA